MEGPNPRGEEGLGTAFGRTRHNKLVFFDADGEALRGRLVHVRIDSVHAYTLYGTMVGGPSDAQPAAVTMAGEQLFVPQLAPV